MTSRSLAVISAGLGLPSSTRLLADRLTEATRAAVELRGDQVAVKVIELRELAHPVVDAVLTGFTSGDLAEALDAVLRSDALIAVTPIFDGSYSGLFKAFTEVVPRAGLSGKPVLLGATGGTARHSLALDFAVRPLFSQLGTLPVPTAVFAATADWGTGTAGSELSSRITRAGDELAAALTRSGSPRTLRPEQSFEELLAASRS